MNWRDSRRARKAGRTASREHPILADTNLRSRSSEGAWIFLSHSHKDVSEVRAVRDALERKGHNPLMFFLKCLDDDSEVDDLIRREISARNIFILCESPNARTSNWVQQERQIIEDLQAKVYEVVDLTDDWSTQLEAMELVSRRATIYLSYTHSDQWIAQQLAMALRARDFKVLTDREISPATDWQNEIHGMIDTALTRGMVLVLLSPDALRSTGMATEIRYAMTRRSELGDSAPIIPIVIRDYGETMSALRDSSEWEDLRNINMLQFISGDSGDVSRIVEMLQRVPLR